MRRLGQVGRAKPSGGLTTAPSYIGTGTGSNAASNPTPAYPANASGDLFLMRIYRNAGIAPTLAGWTQQGIVTGTGINLYVFSRDTRATGSDSGTVTVTMTGTPAIAQIDCFRNVATSSFIESVVTATAGAGSTSLSMPTVTPGGTFRYAYAAVASTNGNAGMASATGESGGDWVELAPEQTSGLGDGIQAQGSSQAGGGAISGGTMVLNTAQGICVAFALVGV